jgi:hypothetical protein
MASPDDAPSDPANAATGNEENGFTSAHDDNQDSQTRYSDERIFAN